MNVRCINVFGMLQSSGKCSRTVVNYSKSRQDSHKMITFCKQKGDSAYFSIHKLTCEYNGVIHDVVVGGRAPIVRTAKFMESAVEYDTYIYSIIKLSSSSFLQPRKSVSDTVCGRFS